MKSTKSSASRLLGDTGELRYHETLHGRCDLVMNWVTKVRQVLNGKPVDHCDLEEENDQCLDGTEEGSAENYGKETDEHSIKPKALNTYIAG